MSEKNDSLTCDQCGSDQMRISYEVQNVEGQTEIICQTCLFALVRKIEHAELN